MSVECRSGLGALEMFAMGLKATGSYLSRTLSYDGAEFSIARVEVDTTFGYGFVICNNLLIATSCQTSRKIKISL